MGFLTDSTALSAALLAVINQTPLTVIPLSDHWTHGDWAAIGNHTDPGPCAHQVTTRCAAQNVLHELGALVFVFTDTEGAEVVEIGADRTVRVWHYTLDGVRTWWVTEATVMAALDAADTAWRHARIETLGAV